MTNKEVMQQALDALERGRRQITGLLVQQDQDAAIAALREELAKPEQEPVDEGDYHQCNAMDTARAALAKATGEVA